MGIDFNYYNFNHCKYFFILSQKCCYNISKVNYLTFVREGKHDRE